MDTEKKTTVKSFVAGRIKILSLDKSDSKEEKAVWRHAFPKAVCEDIKAWALLERDIPDTLIGKRDLPSYSENAAYMSLSAFCACGMNSESISLGRAAAALGDRSRGRFTRLEKSRNLNEFWMNLKCLLRLICSNKGTGIDYGILAKEITDWQFDRIRTVRRWERDYYHSDSKKTKELKKDGN